MRYDFSQNTRTEKHKPKQSPEEGQALKLSEQQRAGQSTAYSNVNATDANLTGPTTSTPFYKSLLATSTDATTNAYDSAKSASRARANAAGFGNSQPITQGGQSEIEAREAGALSRLPAQAMEATVPLQLEASGQQLSEGGTLGTEGQQSFETAANLNNAYQQRRQGFIDNLIGTSKQAAAGAAAGGG